jgi:hypothetical protein
MIGSTVAICVTVPDALTVSVIVVVLVWVKPDSVAVFMAVTDALTDDVPVTVIVALALSDDVPVVVRVALELTVDVPVRV